MTLSIILGETTLSVILWKKQHQVSSWGNNDTEYYLGGNNDTEYYLGGNNDTEYYLGGNNTECHLVEKTTPSVILGKQ